MNYLSLPKIELHIHLDCSLSYKLIKQLNPSISYEEWKQSFVAPPKCTDLADYISRAVKGVELMQTREQLRLATLDLFEQLQADNVIYAEIRFAPLQHVFKVLKPKEVVQAVVDAVEEGMRHTNVIARVLLCTLRHYSEAQSMETVHLVEQFKGSHVVGFDIAADEAGFPIDNHIKAFRFANDNGIFCTAHAGEAKGAESVWETLQHFHPLRIGHGVRSVEDEKLLEYLKQSRVHLEVCPSSNIQVNVFDRIENHPADRIFRSGVSMSISTDARTITPVTLADEYALLEKTFNWQKEHFLKCNLEAVSHSFVDEATRQMLKEKILAGYKS
jgi:adenosine deaminase